MEKGVCGSGWSVSVKETGCPGDKPGLHNTTTQDLHKNCMSLGFTSSMGKFNYYFIVFSVRVFHLLCNFFPRVLHFYVFYKYKKIHWNWLYWALRVDSTLWSCLQILFAVIFSTPLFSVCLPTHMSPGDSKRVASSPPL